MRRLVVIFFLITVVAVGVGAFFLFREFNRGFPQLRPGVYAGTLVSESGGVTLPWFVEASAGAPELSVAVGEGRIPAQRAVGVEPSSGTRLPLIVGGADRRFRMIGKVLEGDEFGGSYTDPINSDRGTWTLKKFDASAIERVQRDELVTWVTTWQALRMIEAKIEDTKKDFDNLSTRIEKLNRYAVEDDSLQKAAGSRLSSTSSTIENLRAGNAAKRSELDAILRNIDIGKRISPEGRLVELSRESILREGRWIEQALHLTAPEASGTFEEDYQRALKVKALQDQIADERGIIRNLVEGPRYRDRSSELQSEEDFYSGLQ